MLDSPRISSAVKHLLALFLLLALPVLAEPSPEPVLVKGKPPALEALPVNVKPSERDEVVRMQIYLDEKLCGPGFIDGKAGNFSTRAAYAYNRSRGRAPDAWDALMRDVEAHVGETYATAVVPEVAREYVNPELPRSRAGQAKMKQMSYRSYYEFMAERYHTSEDFLIELNSKSTVWNLKPRKALVVPNVDPFLIENFKAGRTWKEDPVLSDRTVIIDTNSNQIFIYGPGSGPKVAGTNAASIIVEDAEDEAEAHRKLLAVFPITPGRRQFIHHGTWAIKNSVAFPTWSYDKQFLETGVRSKNESAILNIPGGPNNPIGVIWNGLTKSGIGIHGTSSPRTIGRSVSAGCIRLSNWDAGRFPDLVRPGAKAVIR